MQQKTSKQQLELNIEEEAFNLHTAMIYLSSRYNIEKEIVNLISD
jgi:hypothetical protein